MTTYREIVGKKIKKVTSDPSTGIDGQMWYNSTTGAIRGLAVVSAWASAASMITARGYGAANGTQTASLYTGGLEPGGTYYANTEEYNGSGWSAGGALPTQNYAAGSCGTQTAALFFGGSNNPGGITVNTYTYNGSSWTATPNSLNLGRDYICGTGTQTSALAYCGRVTSPSLAVVTNFEEWNGSSWTALTAAPTAVALSMGSGPETASFFASGGTNNGGPPYVSTAQEYNGSTLSTGGTVNTGRAAGGAAGDSSAGLIFGGDVGGTSQTKTETYDGTSFSEIADMSTAMRGVGNGSGATNAAAVVSGSYGPPALGTTEEFTSSTNVITAAAWSSGGNLNTARYQFAGAGSTPAGLVFGGRKETAPSANYNNSEEYDGTSWTEGNNLNTARFGLYGIGTQTAGLACGGRSTPAVLDNSEEYDGTSYTEGNNLASARHAGASAGTQTAGLIFKGTNVTAPGPANMTTTSQSYDGTSWTATNSCNTAGLVNYGFGTQTAAISVGGNPFSNSGESFDGTNWTAISGTLNDGRQQGFSGGTSTNGLVCGGNSPPNTTNVEAYNGTIFTTAPSLSTARRAMAGTPGTSVPTGVFGAGGYTSTESNSTEEFTPESITGNVKTFSTS